MKAFDRNRHFRNLLLLMLSLLCGAALDCASVPLPWLVGAMVSAAILSAAGRPTVLYAGSRQFAQLLIGATTGLAFTSEALAAVGALILPIVGVVFAMLLIGFAAAWILARIARIDALGAVLATLPIGPAESAMIAERHGIAVMPVILTQCLRMIVLVTALPAIIVFSGEVIGSDNASLMDWTPTGAALLFALAAATGLVARRLRLANPFFLGPCAVAALCSVFGAPTTHFPPAALVIAQLLLGVWLGATIDRRVLSGSPRLLGGAAMATMFLLVLCGGIGLILATWMQESWRVAVLATAPGGVGEMALTAQILDHGVTVVISFHICRIFIIQLLLPPIVRLAGWFGCRAKE